MCQGDDGGHTGECAREGRLHPPDGSHQRQRRHYGTPHHGLRLQDQQLQEYHRCSQDVLFRLISHNFVTGI